MRRRSNPAGPGLVLLDKAVGDSSFRALTRVKETFATRRVGHTGTLDPFASGLLVALVDKATKCARYFSGFDKAYIAEVRFGVETDTCDHTGAPVATAPLPSPERVRAALEGFTGEIGQVPPAYSAVHVGGRRAYELARSGVDVELPERSVNVRELTCTFTGNDTAVLRVICSTGTYIRSLARDLGRAAGSAAHLVGLRRTAVGPFRVEDAAAPEAVAVSDLVPIVAALEQAGVPSVHVAAEVAERMRHGGRVLPQECGGLTDGPVVACVGGAPVAAGAWRHGVFDYHVVFDGPEGSRG